MLKIENPLGQRCYLYRCSPRSSNKQKLNSFPTFPSAFTQNYEQVPEKPLFQDEKEKRQVRETQSINSSPHDDNDEEKTEPLQQQHEEVKYKFCFVPRKTVPVQRAKNKAVKQNMK